MCPARTTTAARRRRKPHGSSTTRALEPIANLTHDALSQYDFPGGGRLRNYMFFARFALAGRRRRAATRDATVFVSLMENGKVEVRVIAPSVLASDGETELLPPLFGVFVLKRHAL